MALARSPFISQLVYASIALRPFSTSELESVLSVSRRKNAECHVTGVLLYEGGMFIQALEGDGADIEAVFQRISADRRHGGVKQLWRGEVAARSFGEWSMGFVNGAAGEVRKLDGYRDFFGKGSLAAFFVNPSRATELVSEFRALPWNRAVANARIGRD